MFMQFIVQSSCQQFSLNILKFCYSQFQITKKLLIEMKIVENVYEVLHSVLLF
jgi:hypothetical protein